ncbi:MAG TPA: orotidine-5'-phosphate decarboxylase [Firmicutes bacterium]|nr:orotidine-5'-phosphate decarboxylase [Bacillota bacterium]
MDLNKIFIALDYTDINKARKTVKNLGGDIVNYKIGHPLFSSCGYEIIEFLKAEGKKVFLDMKYFDIPSVIFSSVKNLVKQRIDFFTVHSLAGSDLLRGIAEITAGTETMPLAVTVLTSIPEEKLDEILLISREFKDVMQILVRRTIESGIRGIVCSPKEITFVKGISERLTVVTPGIRMEKDDRGDQSRVMTPDEAFKSGADFLVIGRSITDAPDPSKIIEYLKNS